jgi:hypothetical protein
MTPELDPSSVLLCSTINRFGGARSNAVLVPAVLLPTMDHHRKQTKLQRLDHLGQLAQVGDLDRVPMRQPWRPKRYFRSGLE